MEAHLNAEKMRKITIERVEKFLSKNEWTDINLLSKIYGPVSSEAVKLQVWSVPNTEPNHTDKVSYAEMLQQPESSFSPAKLGWTYGPEWSTHWLKATVSLPSGWEGKEIHFIWDSTGEALLFKDGQPHQAFNGATGNDRRDFHILTRKASAGEQWNFEIEMVACGMFGNSNGAFLAPPNGTKVFTLKQAEIRVFNRVAYDLWTDLSLILEAAKELSIDDVRSWQAVECARNIVNICHTDDERTWPAALAMAAEFLGKKNGEAQHQVMATGHCHIDTAWLWPYSETRRKVARSWATQCTIADDFSAHVFTASQAQQFEWMATNYPELFKRIQEKTKQGQFAPIGATWIEMDCNIPSGESFARQFLLGQKFFQRNFDGLTCKVFWLPDTFGYSSQLPQIMKLSECDFFLTQKLSWNNINKFPHNTFYWQGLDGTQVLSHFPPADTYVSEANVKDLVQGTKNFKTKDKSNRSMMLFGWGDGGGGPDPHHLARLSRLSDVAGIPKVSIGHPADFFRAVVKDEQEKLAKISASAPALASLQTGAKRTNDIPTWVGELYFELHRGTYTTHARNKLGNRKGEFLLQSVELLSAMAYSASKCDSECIKNISEKLDHLWKLLLINQFHDVLPGTSIGLVYKDSDAHYREIQSTGNALTQTLLQAIAGKGDSMVAFNPLAWPRTALVEIPNSEKPGTNDLRVVNMPGMGISGAITLEKSNSLVSELTPGSSALSICECSETGLFRLESQHLIASIDKHGRIHSLVHKETSRESIAPGHVSNRFVMFEDVPFFWDAWDVEIYHTEKPVAIVGYEQEGNAKILENSPLRVSLEVKLAISQNSTITQKIALDVTCDTLIFETEVDWHENRKFLKVEFPLNVHATQVWYSTQFGCQSRPNHKNTTWDMAKFEVCAHHWADLNEFGFGVAILNDSKYGYSCEENVMRLSLLRSSKQPDADADMGLQKFKYGVLPHRGSHADANLVKKGLEFNVPPVLLLNAADQSAPSLFELATPQNTNVHLPTLVLETVKLPEADPKHDLLKDGKWLILRLWEGSGARGIATFKTSIGVNKIVHVNILENPIADSKKTFVNQTGFFTVPYEPFEVITLAVQIN